MMKWLAAVVLLRSYQDKFCERGLNALEVNAKKTSIRCPVCYHTNKKNIIDKETFKCQRCELTFNAQYIACLNLFSCLNDDRVTVDVAPNEALRIDEVQREKLVQLIKILIVSKNNTQTITM